MRQLLGFPVTADQGWPAVTLGVWRRACVGSSAWGMVRTETEVSRRGTGQEAGHFWG